MTRRDSRQLGFLDSKQNEIDFEAPRRPKRVLARCDMREFSIAERVSQWI